MSGWNCLGKGDSQKKEIFLTATDLKPPVKTKNLENEIHKFAGSYISKGNRYH